VALVAAVVAVASSFFVPPGLTLLLGLVGLVVAGRSTVDKPRLVEVA
jgi:hypothetical protein